jgi:hypothetical protein
MTEDEHDSRVQTVEVQDLVEDQRIPRGTLLGSSLMTQEAVTVKRSFPADHDRHAITLYGIGTLFLHRHTLVKAYPV